MAQNSGRKQTPSFFDEDEALDPVKAATFSPKGRAHKEKNEGELDDTSIEPNTHSAKKISKIEKKKKAGYYFKPSNINRFEKAFLEIQLNGHWKGRQSEFMEAILEFGLVDLESGDQSEILKKLKNK